MAESKALLSQKEIDALVSFLKTNSAVPIGGVLDQASVDKLIELVKYNNSQGIFINSGSPEADLADDTLLLDINSTSEEQRKNCVLNYSVGKSGYAEITCVNKENNNVYLITPACLEQKKYVADDATTWGYAIVPRVFQEIAALLGVSYTTETFSAVTSGFAKLMYGSENAEIPAIYLPMET